jgi:hypothetical protein
MGILMAYCPYGLSINQTQRGWILVQVVDQDVWLIAARDSVSLERTLSGLLNCYVRKAGMDDLVRITPTCIGRTGYETLRDALLENARNDVWYYDHGWHLELRRRRKKRQRLGGPH